MVQCGGRVGPLVPPVSSLRCLVDGRDVPLFEILRDLLRELGQNGLGQGLLWSLREKKQRGQQDEFDLVM